MSLIKVKFDLQTLKGYRTYIAAGLAGLFGVLATVDWGGVLSGHPEGGYTAIVMAVLFALLRSITNTPPLQSTSEEKKD